MSLLSYVPPLLDDGPDRGAPRGRNGSCGETAEAGAIKYHRGQITVQDRPKLEQMCCECYAAVKRESDRLLLQPRHAPSH